MPGGGARTSMPDDMEVMIDGAAHRMSRSLATATHHPAALAHLVSDSSTAEQEVARECFLGSRVR
jgi:hypothetical protein